MRVARSSIIWTAEEYLPGDLVFFWFALWSSGLSTRNVYSETLLNSAISATAKTRNSITSCNNERNVLCRMPKQA